ncbi:competence protein CoiA family protein [Anabaena sp. PCC 7108]|uniref:competence protein CoiA family protein n=1 Tax=Anabaena sp. PCC 7108 TaxID=163908 RepID=UPI00034ADE78|nr:competence protein CoiA family protein [Anabaena sp. PCC 7108]
MDNAISIYLGGEEVYAKNCNFNSYLELGLICPVCEQEVYLRRGDIKEPYFAHFHASNYRQVKQCSRRVSSDETATETNEFIEDRGQRLKIFQDHFLSKFSIENSKIVDDVNFKKWINSKKGGNNKAINNILLESVEYFIIYRQQMTDKYLKGGQNQLKD